MKTNTRWTLSIVLFYLFSFALAQEQEQEQEVVVETQQQKVVYENAIVPDGTSITKLTLSNFASFIKSNDLILGEFTVPWCVHSKILLPELVKAADALDQEKGIKVFQVDCSVDGPLCDQVGISYYPALKAFKNHRLIKENEYTGRRTSEDMYDFMVNQVASPVKRINSEEQLNGHFLNKDNMESPVVVYYGNVDGFDSVFDKAANELFNSFTFVAYKDCNETMNGNVTLYLPPVAPEELEQNNHTVRPDTDIFNFENVTSSTKVDDLKSWLLYSRLPYFDNANIENYRLYMESKLPLAYFFYIAPKEYMENKEFFSELGKKYRGKMNFLALNALIFHSHVQFLNMKEQFPLFAIHDLKYNLKYGLPQMSDEEYKSQTEILKLDQGDMAQLIEDFMNGDAVPVVKSEDIPTEQHGNITKIVGLNHDDMVRDPKRDVVVRYFASWCAQSRKFEPIYNNIADMFAGDEETKDKIVFLDVDASANDILSFPVTGFPTVVIYPAGSTDAPIVHSSVAARNNILLFIRENGFYHLDGFELVKKYHLDDEDEEEAGEIAQEINPSSEETSHDEL
ncbi:similar to Saccharomyces cerevisiae YDR518W EUG1 Protein disulfide isomerase of the endoplasmic reticulum lumen, function overlaps with that of Pdi1p [Maudiozyma barnettii]|uniref:protein disulfide-isomerase n=1 Tax=Maudiozyma barnettii TaxID=61262 RepID=A0A8H2ZI73_9SACH|nr:protein disulfide isomerase EUG1 [Kazachstania barnettii]CAB4255227.1 similar to Saccharomyces cerevisiae YDR518W EUG1 Protein disulfide isomerase of the endoplasmic reticulum lumen, function overlaps with that of Pdi1p [Kazachstania barnettii]CAD1783635.1 similar to Saccharomyces cerevisiae YDR518W EUG1 Protein disulfide isomerase of the endoplasmic reticulum lumen, function overlaps with that of Pdi1p [Kazachstania barnettii]